MPKEVNKKPLQSMKPQKSEEQKIQEMAMALMKEKTEKCGAEINAICKKYGMQLVVDQVVKLAPERR